MEKSIEPSYTLKLRNVLLFPEAVAHPDASRRYQARHALLSSMVKRLGFEIYNSNLLWTSDMDYISAWRRFPGANADVKDRKFVLHSMVASVANLSGDTAECGVFTGGSSFLICDATQSVEGRQHHVFDSFEGLSEPQTNDLPEAERTFRWKKNDLSVPVEVVQKNLSFFPGVRYYKGWIPERFHEVADRKFCFVHVDVDLYEPTRDSLAFFYDRLVPGGILLCGDYGFTSCPGAKRAFDEIVVNRPERRVVHLPTGQGFIVKR